MAYVYDEDNNSKEPVFYYESNDAQDQAFAICAHYKHGFLFRDGTQNKNTSEVKLVEVTHPSDESISLLFRIEDNTGLGTCSDFHKLAEPLGFSTEQEYLDLGATAPTWMHALYNDPKAIKERTIRLNIANDEIPGKFKKLTDTSGISEFYVPGLDENRGINQSVSNKYQLNKIGLDVDATPINIVPNKEQKENVCILRAKSGWKNVPYRRISGSGSGSNDHLQINMIKSDMAYSNQFSLCESMGAHLPYLKDFTQVSLIYAFVDSQLNEFETFSVMETNHLFTNDEAVVEYDISEPLNRLGMISNVVAETKSSAISNVMCVKNGSPYNNFTVARETVTEEGVQTFAYTSFNKESDDIDWNDLHSVKLNRHLFELDLKSGTSLVRPNFTVDHLRNYCESTDSYPKNCWKYNLTPDDSALSECPYLGDQASITDMLFPKPLPADEQKCTHDELIYSQRNGKISRLRLERRKLPLEEAKQRCNSFGMDIYTPYTLNEVRQLLQWLRRKNSWLGSTAHLAFWTNLEWTNSDKPEIISPNDVVYEEVLRKFYDYGSICFNYINDQSNPVSSVASYVACKFNYEGYENDLNFMCVERIQDSYKQQRKIVINYEHNTKEVIIDFVPSVHVIRFRNNNELVNKTTEAFTGRAKPQKKDEKIPISYIGAVPWDGNIFTSSYFESKIYTNGPVKLT